MTASRRRFPLSKPLLNVIRPVTKELGREPTVLAPPRRRLRKFFVSAATFIGICEALTMSPWLDMTGLPEWLSSAIAAIGFVAFIVLVGPFGNAAAALGLFLLGRLRWKWLLWRCIAVALPFIYVTYRLSPKPW